MHNKNCYKYPEDPDEDTNGIGTRNIECHYSFSLEIAKHFSV